MNKYTNPMPGSFLLPLLWHVLHGLYELSLISLFRRLAKRIPWTGLQNKMSWKENPEHLGLGALEAYVFIWAISMGTLLVAGARSGLIVVFAVWRLGEIAVAVLHTVFAEPQDQCKYVDNLPAVHVTHPSRWVAMSVIQVFEIVVNFAILRLFFASGALGPGGAFHQSLCVTVFNPLPNSGQTDGAPMWLDSVHLLYSLFFFLVVLPIAISSIRIVLWKTGPAAHGSGLSESCGGSPSEQQNVHTLK